MDNYNYPIGADSSDAPWNQEENEDVEVEVLVTQTLKKQCKINTDDYYIERGDDKPTINQYTLDKKFCDCRYTILEMIDMLKHYAQDELKNTIDGSGLNAFLKRLIEDCDGWEVVETDVVLI